MVAVALRQETDRTGFLDSIAFDSSLAGISSTAHPPPVRILLFSRRLRFLYLLRLATDLYLSVPFDVTSCILFFSLSLFLCEPYLNLKVNRTHCTRPPLTLLLFQYLLTSLRLNTPVNCDTFNFFILICVPVNKSALFFGPFPASFKNSFIFFYLHIEIDYIGIPIQYSVIFHI